MPDPKRLHSFLSRTQNWLQRSLDDGDQQGADYYEGLMDRGNQLAERMLQQQQINQQEPPQSPYVNPHQEQGNGYGTDGKSMDMGTLMGGWVPPDDMKRPVGRVMMYNEPQRPSLPPGGQYQLASPPDEQAATSGQQTGAGTGQAQLTPLYDLSKLNQPDKIEVDLNQEMQTPTAPAKPFMNPFEKPVSAARSWADSFPRKPEPGVRVKPAEPAPSYATPDEVVSGFALTDLLPWRKMTPADEAELAKSNYKLKNFLTEPVRKWGDTLPENELSEVPIEGSTGKPVTWTEAQNKPGGDTASISPTAPFTPGSEAAATSGEPEKAPSRYDSDPSFRERIDMMGQVKQTATDPFEKEFLTRVERELGKKPSFFSLETLATLLLMGAPRAYQNFQNDKARYQQGKMGIAKEMRSEMNAKRSNAYREQKDKLDRDIQLQRIQAQFLPDAIKQSLAPIFKEIDKLSSELNTRVQNVGIDPSTDQRAQQIRSQLEELNAQAEGITRTNLPMVKRPDMNVNQ